LTDNLIDTGKCRLYASARVQFVSEHFGLIGKGGKLNPRDYSAESLESRRLLSVSVQDLGVTVDDSPAPVEMNGTLFFLGKSAETGWELYKSDGTVQGTSCVKDIVPGSLNSNPMNLTKVNGTLFFTAFDTAGVALWKSDGTTAGTVIVRRFAGGFVHYLFDGNGTLYFSARDANDPAGEEPWISDGTFAGTKRLKDMWPGTDQSFFYPEYYFKNKLYFQTAVPAGSTNTGWELGATDGTSNGTYLVKDINPGEGNSDPGWFMQAGGRLYFCANTDQYGAELWTTDGTDAGTYMVKDFISGATDGNPQPVIEMGGMLYTVTHANEGKQKLYKTDPATNVTTLVTQFSTTSVNSPAYYFALIDPGHMFFYAADDTHGTELWISDGTSAGTHMVTDLRTGSTSGVDPTVPIRVSNGLAYFCGIGSAGDTEVWATDGTAAGTFLVKDQLGKTNSAIRPSITISGDKVFFFVNTTYPVGNLWVAHVTAPPPPPPPGGSISGTVYNDANNNAKRDSGEAGVAGVTIYNDANNNSKMDVGEKFTTTDGGGLYVLGGLSSGSYKIREILESGWVQTTPANNYGWTISLATNQVLAGKDFGTRQTNVTPPPTGGSISGTVWNDLDGDGMKDSNEVGVANMSVYNDANNNSKLDTGEKTTVTDATGLYSLRGLSSGSYKIRQILQSGWVQTTPANNYSWTITLASNQQLTGKDFGTRQTNTTPPPTSGGSIAGIVWNDLDGDRVKDAGEAGVANITIYNDANNNSKLDAGEKTTVTDASGAYTLSGLASGSYKIREILQSGWVQTTPTNNYGWTITLASNQQLAGKDFGTKQSATSTSTTGGTISGMIFNDLDGDGRKDSNEVGVGSAWTVYIDLDNDSMLDSNEVRTTTDSNGNWTLSNLAAGTYKVRQVLQTGWKQTTPSNNYGLNVTLATKLVGRGKFLGPKNIA
jgi:ELWxxDGT repeat protein